MVFRRLVSGVVGAALLLPGAVFAHSTVSPTQTATSKYESFSLSVPTEKDIPTVGMRLIVPAELDRVTPVVKPGWNIQILKDATGKVTELSWTGGSIPAGQKDFFIFSGRTPATSTVLVWKAYQTYRDGTVVNWDQTPSDEGHDAVANPYSTTVVSAPIPAESGNWQTASPAISFLALAVSIVALALALQNRKHGH